MTIIIDGLSAIGVNTGVSTVNSTTISVGNAVMNSSSFYYNSSELPSVDAASMHNIIVNGEMRISQQNGNTQSNTGTYWGTDLFVTAWSSAVMVANTYQSSDCPGGYNNSYRVSVTTANNAPGSSDYFLISCAIEGQRLTKLGWGTSAAIDATFGMWVKCSITGTFSIAFSNDPWVVVYVVPFTIAAPNAWQWVTFIIPGTQSGTWLIAPSTRGMDMNICLGGGSSTYGTGNTWNTSGTQRGITAQTNLAATSGATFQATGLMLLPGGYIIPANTAQLIQRHYDRELELCMRYYRKLNLTLYNYLSGVSNYGGAIYTGQLSPSMMPSPGGSWTSFGNTGWGGTVNITGSYNNWIISSSAGGHANGTYNTGQMYLTSRP